MRLGEYWGDSKKVKRKICSRLIFDVKSKKTLAIRPDPTRDYSENEVHAGKIVIVIFSIIRFISFFC